MDEEIIEVVFSKKKKRRTQYGAAGADCPCDACKVYRQNDPTKSRVEQDKLVNAIFGDTDVQGDSRT